MACVGLLVFSTIPKFGRWIVVIQVLLLHVDQKRVLFLVQAYTSRCRPLLFICFGLPWSSLVKTDLFFPDYSFITRNYYTQNIFCPFVLHYILQRYFIDAYTFVFRLRQSVEPAYASEPSRLDRHSPESLRPVHPTCIITSAAISSEVVG